MEQTELLALIKTGKLVNVDLSGGNYNNINFSGCTLHSINFKGCSLRQCTFEEAHLSHCNFDAASLDAVSFKRAEMLHCRFRDARLQWCDFRYANMDNGSFEGAIIDYCDFYRTFLCGVIMFRKASIANTSLYNTYFGDGANIRKENLRNGRIVQQRKECYKKFLSQWPEHYGEQRTNDQKQQSNWDADNAVKNRWEDAEEIYRTLNGVWTQKGFIADANWAYVECKRAERCRMWHQIGHKGTPWYTKIANVWHIFTNACSDLFFGYGESMFKMILTYMVTILIFAALFSSQISILVWLDAFGISLKNMVGLDSEVLRNVSPIVDILNVMQTTIGLLLTGIFGFILGNKIRNQ